MGGPYSILPLFAILLFAYLSGIFMVRNGFLTKVVHRRFWNLILLITFLVTAVLGLLLAIQINYKLEWSWVRAMLKWHVDFGIAMTMVGVFHLLWHLSYYLNLFKYSDVKRDKKPDLVSETASTASGTMDREIVALGFSSAVIQVLLIREIALVFQGNELMMGWTLGIWMFLTGMGAWLGRSFTTIPSENRIHRMLGLLLSVPPIALVAMEAGKNLLFLPGTQISPFWFILLILMVLLPVCLTSGLAYSLLVKVQGSEEKRFVRVYALESVGSMAGGVVVSFLLVRWFSILASLLIVALAVRLFLLSRKGRELKPILPTVITAVLLLLVLLWPVDLKLKSLLFYHQQVIDSKESPYGNITVTENGGELSFFENGSLLFSTGDLISNEEYVHYALLQRENPRSILLVSGGISGMIGEILKYSTVEQIDYPELNPHLIEMGRRYNRLSEHPKVMVIPGDGRRFLQQTDRFYDMAILAVPDATSLQLNRFYSSEFLTILKKRMNENGVVLFAVSPAGNYLSPEKIHLEALIYHTVKEHFRRVELIPGEKDFFIASDGPLSIQIAELATLRGIRNNYVNSDYIDDRSILDRSQQILGQIGGYKEINSDNRPLPVFYHSLRFLAQFSGRQFGLALIPLLILLLPLFLLNPVSGAMYVTGFSASAIEILLIFWIQVTFGYIYSVMGLIFAIFMGGLAPGAIAGHRMEIRRGHVFGAQSLLMLYLLLFPLLWSLSKASLPAGVIWLLIVPATFIPALLTGFQYVASTVTLPGRVESAPSIVYAADLWGSALGIMATTILFVPLLGVAGTSLLLAGINLIVILINWIRRR